MYISVKWNYNMIEAIITSESDDISFNDDSSSEEEKKTCKNMVTLKKVVAIESNNDNHVLRLIKEFADEVRKTIRNNKKCKYHEIKYNLLTNLGCRTSHLLTDLILNASSIPTSVKIIWHNNTKIFPCCISQQCERITHKKNLRKMLILLYALLISNDKISMYEFSVVLSDIKSRTPKLSPSNTINNVWISLKMDDLIKGIFKKEDYRQCGCISTLGSIMKVKFPHFYGIITCDEQLLDTIFTNTESSLNKIITNDDIFLLTKYKFVEVRLSHISNIDNYFELIGKLVYSDNKMCKKISTVKFKSEKVKLDVPDTINYPKYIYYVNNNLLSGDEHNISITYVNKHSTLYKIKMLEHCQLDTNTFNQHVICANCASYSYVCESTFASRRSLRPKINDHILHFMKMIYNIIYHFPLIFDIKKHIMVLYNHMILEKVTQMAAFY